MEPDTRSELNRRKTVITAKAIAESNGFRDLASYETLNPGDKVYFINREKSMYLAVIGTDKLENGIQDEQRILELLLNKYPNLRVVLITDKKGAYYKDKDMMIYQKELVSNFDKDLFLVKYMASELKGNSEMTSLYRGVNQ